MMKLISNRVKYKTTLTIMLLLSSLFVLTGCGSGGGGGASTGGSGTTSVSINLNVPGNTSTGAGPSAAAAAAPKPVNILEIEISGDGEIYVSEQHSVTSGQTFSATYQIPTGANRTVTIRAFDGTELLYMGESTVDLSGQATAITIEMDLVVDVDYAINLLENGDFVGARDILRGAVVTYGEGSDFESTANFFYAITRIFAIWYDMESDGANDGLLDVGDILDAFDCSEVNRDPDNFDIDFVTDIDPLFTGVSCPDNLPTGYPTGGNLQDFIRNVLRPELIGAIENLENVSDDFKITWTEPFDNTLVESDYGDVLFLRAVAKAAMAVVENQDAYNLNVILDLDLDNNTMQSIFFNNPGFPDLVDPSKLSVAKSYLQANAIDDIESALDWMLGEGVINDLDDNDQFDDWISLVDMTDSEICEARNDIATARLCLAGECILDDNEDPADPCLPYTNDPSDDTVVNLNNYFAGLVSINSLLPTIDGLPGTPYFDVDDPNGFFPDPTFGMFVTIEGYDPDDLNIDADGDGTADSLDSSIYYVYGGTYLPADPYSQSFRDDPGSEDYELIDAADPSIDLGSVDFVGSGYYYYYITSHTAIPSFVDREDVTIDALEFIGTGAYCCESGEFWVNDWSLWQLFNSQSQDLDGITGIMSEHDRTLVHDTLFGTGLRVYSIYP